MNFIQLRERFTQLYGPGPIGVLRAPARINILGEHVDYVSYLPTASLTFGSREHAMVMLFRATDDGRVRGASTHAAYEPFDFELREYDGDAQAWDDYVVNRPPPAPHWSNYVRGAVCFARWRHGAALARGYDFLIDASMPASGGASSSSALTVLAGAAIRPVNGIDFKLNELARESAQAEWFVGTRGGAMDHTTICLARRGSVIHIRHRNVPADLLPSPDEALRWVTFFAHAADKGREAMLEYNERAAVSRLLIPALIYAPGAAPELPAAITLAEVKRRFPAVFWECTRLFPALVRARFTQPLKVRNRAMHHYSEVVRVGAAVALLTGGPQTAEAQRFVLGGLLNQAHASLRELYEVSTPEVERLIEIVRADAAVAGARLMGGGFGGNVLALTTAERVPALIERVQAQFYGPRGRDAVSEGAVMVSTPGDGLQSIAEEGDGDLHCC